ncbi:MAG TPA: YqhV family protein [Firmicutes bacterium]|nr:YqhV family protein [Bacillota bacterium]
MGEEKFVAGMALLRLLSGTVELTAAVLMLHFHSLETAFRINGFLGLVGPSVLILVSALGLSGLAGQIPSWKLGVIAFGVACILIGTRS